MDKKQIASKRIKLPRCKACRNEFFIARIGQKVCSSECAISLLEKEKEKEIRAKSKIDARVTKQRKEAIKTRSEWMKEAQQAFNAFVRERDKDQPCICCGRTEAKVTGGHGWDCGHYRSVGSAPHLRFNEENAHRQLVYCNRYGAGRAVDYRIGLIKKIGIIAVEKLESDQEPCKFDIEQLKSIKKLYKEKLKELKRINGSHCTHR